MQRRLLYQLPAQHGRLLPARLPGRSLIRGTTSWVPWRRYYVMLLSFGLLAHVLRDHLCRPQRPARPCPDVRNQPLELYLHYATGTDAQYAQSAVPESIQECSANLRFAYCQAAAECATHLTCDDVQITPRGYFRHRERASPRDVLVGRGVLGCSFAARPAWKNITYPRHLFSAGHGWPATATRSFSRADHIYIGDTYPRIHLPRSRPPPPSAAAAIPAVDRLDRACQPTLARHDVPSEMFPTT